MSIVENIVVCQWATCLPFKHRFQQLLLVKETMRRVNRFMGHSKNNEATQEYRMHAILNRSDVIHLTHVYGGIHTDTGLFYQ